MAMRSISRLLARYADRLTKNIFDVDHLKHDEAGGSQWQGKQHAERAEQRSKEHLRHDGERRRERHRVLLHNGREEVCDPGDSFLLLARTTLRLTVNRLPN